jgi:hypothetical protein
LTLFNPDHLFEQAELLIKPARGGTVRQVDLRRSVSAAYYGVFHYTLTAATDELIGVTRRGSARYTLVYRSVDHRALRTLCAEMTRPHLSTKYRKFEPANGFAPDLRAFATGILELQEMRHAADYDPSSQLSISNAALAIGTAKEAIDRFGRVNRPERQVFLALLLFPPR